LKQVVFAIRAKQKKNPWGKVNESTWLSDMKKANPALAKAYAIVGNQPRFALRNMVKALSLHPLLNTEEDSERLKAAKFILSQKNLKESSPYNKLEAACDNWESAQIPEKKTSVCFNCGFPKDAHKKDKKLKESSDNIDANTDDQVSFHETSIDKLQKFSDANSKNKEIVRLCNQLMSHHLEAITSLYNTGRVPNRVESSLEQLERILTKRYGSELELVEGKDTPSHDLLDGIKKGIRQAKKSNNHVKNLYYRELWVKYGDGNLKAFVPFEQFIGSWAGEEWLKKHEAAAIKEAGSPIKYPCPKCKGSGKTSEGYRCFACQGNGTDNAKYFNWHDDKENSTDTTVSESRKPGPWSKQ